VGIKHRTAGDSLCVAIRAVIRKSTVGILKWWADMYWGGTPLSELRKTMGRRGEMYRGY